MKFWFENITVMIIITIAIIIQFFSTHGEYGAIITRENEVIVILPKYDSFSLFPSLTKAVKCSSRERTCI